ncbi:L-lysine exporter family protein LysE/ArgO [Lipingzhangella halophila]|uniref:L-lysine exporter family protein LysE/ArgO n=1 Tax=Lipingzhangella halophila TaxID=1783352 RepID=A0A7W7W1K1_9ACTN|nr:LysE family transporter [Lipingzhangella halophila]MBB4929834.1 L-lysine exporter family protein LysE/ArgO [Lipingzhangella halophila]
MVGGYLSGLALGFALIGPVGPQNLYVIRAGIGLSVLRVLVVVLAATLCDALLISLGAAGAGAVVTRVPGVHATLLAGGCVFLVYLGRQSLRAPKPELDLPSSEAGGMATMTMTRQTVGVSLLNPHAILDTTVVIGAAAAAHAAGDRVAFAVGAVSASLLWFVLIGYGANAFRRWVTPAVAQWIERGSGIVLLVFAGKLAIDFVHHVTGG